MHCHECIPSRAYRVYKPLIPYSRKYWQSSVWSRAAEINIGGFKFGRAVRYGIVIRMYAYKLVDFNLAVVARTAKPPNLPAIWYSNNNIIICSPKQRSIPGELTSPGLNHFGTAGLRVSLNFLCLPLRPSYLSSLEWIGWTSSSPLDKCKVRTKLQVTSQCL